MLDQHVERVRELDAQWCVLALADLRRDARRASQQQLRQVVAEAATKEPSDVATDTGEMHDLSV